MRDIGEGSISSVPRGLCSNDGDGPNYLTKVSSAIITIGGSCKRCKRIVITLQIVVIGNGRHWRS